MASGVQTQPDVARIVARDKRLKQMVHESFGTVTALKTDYSTYLSSTSTSAVSKDIRAKFEH